MDGFLGEIVLYPNSTPPSNWLQCDGQLLLISEYNDLYSVIGTKFGGNGTTTFGLPDLQSIEPDPDTYYVIKASGTESRTSYVSEIIIFAGNGAPSDWAVCDGSLKFISSYGDLYSLIGTTYGGNGETTFGLPDLSGSAPTDTNYIICLQGLYP